MKLASRKKGLDGQLVVVSRDLTHCLAVPQIAPTLQAALDKWPQTEALLKRTYEQLNSGQLPGAEPFVPQHCASPLPRAFQWADGSAYVNHVELVRKARGAEMPASFWTDPLMYQGGSDGFLAPYDNIPISDVAQGCDIEGEVAVITAAVPQGASVAAAADKIVLLMLVNDVTLRNLVPDELAKGFGFFQAKPASAFSPVAVTPDELGDAWQDCKVHLPLHCYVRGQKLGAPHAGQDMTFNFAQLIAHAAKTRSLAAGSIIGSGTVSNIDRSHGSACLAEQRMLEIIAQGKATTPFLQIGDSIKIEMLDLNGQSIFGAIEQQVVQL